MEKQRWRQRDRETEGQRSDRHWFEPPPPLAPPLRSPQRRRRSSASARRAAPGRPEAPTKRGGSPTYPFWGDVTYRYLPFFGGRATHTHTSLLCSLCSCPFILVIVCFVIASFLENYSYTHTAHRNFRRTPTVSKTCKQIRCLDFLILLSVGVGVQDSIGT